MSSLIKHEFRATARLILPFLAVSVFSSLLLSLLDNGRNGTLTAVLGLLCVLSLMALAVAGLIIIVSRFYRNTMTDEGYLTMTLPVSAHEFVWAELIMCLLWFLITAVILFSTLMASFVNLNMISMPEAVSDLRNLIFLARTACTEHGVNIFMVFVSVLECVVFAVLAFFGYCLRIYNAMAIGQVFSSRRTLCSVIAYIVLGIVLAVVSVIMLNVFGEAFNLELDSAGKIAEMIGLFDLMLAVIDALMYFPTVFLISRKLNLP